MSGDEIRRMRELNRKLRGYAGGAAAKARCAEDDQSRAVYRELSRAYAGAAKKLRVNGWE